MNKTDRLRVEAAAKRAGWEVEPAWTIGQIEYVALALHGDRQPTWEDVARLLNVRLSKGGKR